MVAMMFRPPFEGTTLFAKMINLYALQLPPILGHRNRIKYLEKQIEMEACAWPVRDASRGSTISPAALLWKCSGSSENRP